MCIRDRENLVLDLNGTLTESGDFIPGVFDYLEKLKVRGFRIYILSGDTRETLKYTFPGSSEIEPVVTRTAQEKRAFVESIGAKRTVCVGNGNIDVEMFRVARLSICTIQAEGATFKTSIICLSPPALKKRIPITQRPCATSQFPASALTGLSTAALRSASIRFASM